MAWVELPLRKEIHTLEEKKTQATGRKEFEWRSLTNPDRQEKAFLLSVERKKKHSEVSERSPTKAVLAHTQVKGLA